MLADTSKVYNSLTHIRVAQNTPMPKVTALLQVIKKYKLQKILGVARLHKHYEIQQGEFVVWKVDGDFANSQIEKDKKAPMCFVLQESQWIPTQYYEGEDIWSQLQKSNEFIEWTLEIKEIIAQDTNIYGLILKIKEGGDMEETEASDRTQKVGPKESKQYKGEVVTKYWAEGSVGECNGHHGSCYSYCCVSSCYSYCCKVN